MATKKQDGEAVILRDCVFGKAGEVVTLSPADAETAAAQGMVDLAPAAIAYAKSQKAE